MKDLGFYNSAAMPNHAINLIPVALDESADFTLLQFAYTFGKAPLL